MTEERDRPRCAARRRPLIRILNPSLVILITIASFVLLDAYFKATDEFVYTSEAQRAVDYNLSVAYVIFGIFVYFVVGFLYERPIHKALGVLNRGEKPPEQVLSLARIRAMNAPVTYCAVTVAIWLFAMVLFPFLLTMIAPPVSRGYWLTSLLISFFDGAFVTVLTYFLLSSVSRWLFLPKLFPLGHLDAQAGAHSLSIKAQHALVFVSICVLPLLLNLSNLAMCRFVLIPEVSPQELTLKSLTDYHLVQSAYLSFFSFIMGLGIVLSLAVNQRRSLKSVGEAVERVHKGDLTRFVQVTSNDELGKLGDGVNEMIIGLRERNRIVEAFNRYVDRTLTKQVLDGELTMGGVQVEVSVLFCDIRSYTTLSEGMEPEKVVGMLNRYFTRMAEAIEVEGGTVNKFIGDGILAVFGAPRTQTDHRDRALRAALAMCAALEEFNEGQKEDLLPHLKIGIGIHSGLVLAGNIGTPHKIEYTVIGDPVNVAQRLDEVAGEKGIPLVCSGATLGPYKQRYAHEALGLIGVRGRVDPIDIYSLTPAATRPRMRGEGGEEDVGPEKMG